MVARTLKVILIVIRSDRGVETLIMTDAHYELKKAAAPEANFQINNVFAFDKNIYNVRIENWWRQLSKCNLYR